MMSILVDAAEAGLAGTALVYGAAAFGSVLHFLSVSRGARKPVSVAGLLGHLFPLPLLRSRWTRLDIFVYVLNKLLAALVFPSAFVMVLGVAGSLRDRLAISGVPRLHLPYHSAAAILWLLLSLMLRDFIGFYLHMLQHRIPLLWEFHKVHHAPESLIPPTSQRLHPLELIINMLAESLSLGVLLGVYGWATEQNPTELTISAAGIYAIVNIVTFSPLRHSHIDLRLGWLEYIFLSPAHHQLHHSVERQHWHKNFAAIFPLWDWLWNTLETPPASRSDYRLGLPNNASEDYATVFGCYVTPFVQIWRRFGVTGATRKIYCAVATRTGTGRQK